MADHFRRAGKFFKRSGLVIFFLLSSAAVLFSQDGLLTVEVSETSLAKNDRFKFTIIADHSNYNDITVVVPEEMEGLQIYAGPVKRHIIESAPDGINIIRKSSISYTLRARETGRHALPSFTVFIRDIPYQTEPVLIEVGLYKNRKFYIPYDAYWQAGLEEAYVGESIPLTLFVRNEMQIGIFPDKKTSAPNGGFWEEVSGLGEIEQGVLVGNTVYTIPVAGYIFTPTRDGRLVIPAAEIESDISQGKASSLIIQVNPTPEEIDTTGAVGDFTYSYSLSSQEIYLGEELVLTIAVEGTGNLNYLQLPEPGLDNLEYLETRTSEEIHAFSGGYRGSRKAEYIYRPINEGDAFITVPAFPYLNRISGEIITESGIVFRIPVAPEMSAEEEIGKLYLPVSLEGCEEYFINELYSDPLNYLLLLPGLAALLIGFILKRRKTAVIAMIVLFLSASTWENREISEEPWDLFAAEEYYRAAAEFYLLAVDTENNSALFYNASICFFQSGDIGKSVQSLRKAVFLDPYNSSFREFMKIIEKESGLPFQEDDVFLLHPDMFFLIFLILWNLGCAAFTVVLFKRSSIMVIVIITLIILTILAASGIIVSVSARSTEIGIVRLDSTKVKKIPRADSGASYLLNSGQSLHLEGYSEPYYLIKTKNGITGWLHKNDLYIDNENIREISTGSPGNE